MRVFLSAGEPSGDACAAALVDELKKTGETFEFQGMGQQRMQKAIGSLVADSSPWGVVSIMHSLRILPAAFAGAWRARFAMLNGTPGLFVAVDYGYFNIRQSRWAKRHGWKVLYFMPPSSYNRVRQGRDLPDVTDAVVTPFPWSEEILKGLGVNVRFFGHPLKQLINMSGAKHAPIENRVAVLPGSRISELVRHLPLAAGMLTGRVPNWGGGFSKGAMHERLSTGREPLGVTYEFAISPNLSVDKVRAEWEKLAPGRNDIFTQGDTCGVLGRARAAIVCSGTATLEAALMRCPHVVVYRITKGMAREGRIIGFKKPRFIGLPNIVLDRPLVEEFAGLEVDPRAIRATLEPLIGDSPERAAQLAGFEEVDQILGPADAITKTAEFAITLGARA